MRTITALSLAALAESATPYGIEAFDTVLKPLWKGIRQHRGKGLAAFLKAIGFIIPLMDAEYANYYTREASRRPRARRGRVARPARLVRTPRKHASPAKKTNTPHPPPPRLP